MVTKKDIEELGEKLTTNMDQRVLDMLNILNSIKEENKNFAAELKKVNVGMQAILEENEELKERCAAVEGRCNQLELENNLLKKSVVENQIESNNAEQNSRKYTLIFKNIKTSVEDKPKQCIEKILSVCNNVLEMNITEADIAACHPLPSKRGGVVIIARFLNLHNADTIFYHRKETKDMSQELRNQLGVPEGKNVLISPNLTSMNSKLMTQAWQLKDKWGYKFVWANNKGKVFVRKSETTEVKTISTTNDILKLQPNFFDADEVETEYLLC